MTSGITATPSSPVPAGVWRVDPTASTLAFRARGMFGLATVKGTFKDFDGTLTVEELGLHGELRIRAESLDTGNAKRDTHLRSDDFFGVANDPIVTFALTEMNPASSGTASARGTLHIRDTALDIAAPVTVTTLDRDRVQLGMTVSVDRAAAGVGWSKLGMVQGKAHLEAIVELIRAETGGH